MGRQHAIKPACRAPGSKEDRGNRPGQMLAAVRWGRARSPESDRSYRCYMMYISTCSRSVSLPGISSPRGQGFDYSQIFLQLGSHACLGVRTQ